MKTFFKFSIILIFLFSLLMLPTVVLATDEGIDLDCVREKLLAGEDTSVCSGSGGGGDEGDVNSNFFNITFTPDQAGAAKIVRTLITIALAALVLGSIFYGVYGIYVRSTAGTDENKMKESVSIFKNAVLALVITAGGIVLVQLLSIFLGLGNVWELNFTMEQATADKFANCPKGEELKTDQSCRVWEEIDGRPQSCPYEYVGGKWVKTSSICAE